MPVDSPCSNLAKGKNLMASSLALLLLWSSQSTTQDVPAASTDPAREPIRVDEEVIVRGRRLSEIEFDLRIHIGDFIDEIAAPARTRGFARWQRGVCIAVYNLDNTVAQYIVDRISSLARDVGLEAGEPGCAPQVNIVFVTDASETAALMVEASPRAFRPIGGNAGMDLGLEALDEFTQSDRAVRWWHVSLPTDARTGVPVVRIPGDPPPTVLKSGASRLYDGIRDDMQNAIIIVDSTKLTATSWRQIADYLAVVSLAQVDPWGAVWRVVKVRTVGVDANHVRPCSPCRRL